MHRRLRTRLFHAARVGLSASALTLAGTALGCDRDSSGPPEAEFLVTTADSTFWVQTGANGIRIRAVPMTLASFDGRFHEVFVADLDRSFDDAVFTGERVYVRDLQSNDSLLVYDDTAIVAMAVRHTTEFPNATPLRADDETPQDPRISAYGETDVLEVRGPYALLEHRTTYQMRGGSQHDTVQAAIDLRTGRAATQLAMSRDSVRDDSSVARTTPRSWIRQGYTLNVRSAGEGSVSISLRDSQSRTWPVLTVSEHPRVYWLDDPPLDSAARRALRRAFNSAAAYDEAVKYVGFLRPPDSPSTGRAPASIGHA
ncbi:MAG: hypothetical protein M3Z30_09325 [Gemmatimonadota bacterium]|nr:hypothetical protein [Gemmatimonadota bacterium]